VACTEDSLREGNELPKVSVLVTIWRGGAQAFLPVLDSSRPGSRCEFSDPIDRELRYLRLIRVSVSYTREPMKPES
jgi:hypothetical protein